MHAARGRGPDESSVCADKIGHKDHIKLDGLFTWQEVECLGACCNAPMAQINDYDYEDLTAETLTRILNDLAAGKTPKPGPQVDRQNSAPIGGADTLTDPAIYKITAPSAAPGAALQDSEAKKPGEAANLQEAPMPKPPITNSTGQQRN